ncbi:P1 family peptidase [Yimella sp. cx-51]|uniref:P1 family peptidase n=1 Tax=Yimella sp. cx-51 TaxID=2770551 RepID=UPI00165E205C|nr:P1 family peptidase [Yimella sp. cx-51]MBC9955524.1 P1 family peptidase [Yimella sp. cx-51]QTH37891.1 P1 family peptidase [Yimella sp. cx-51]
MSWQPGPTNCLTDVPGLRVGHHTRRGDGWLTGTTVVRLPDDGAVAGVDVRGGGPGTRETDLLDPRNLIERVHAIVLSGGSAFGLAAADGVMQALADEGIGFPVDAAGRQVPVPIVPAAVVFDLGRGGEPTKRPDASFGAQALAAATADAVEQGSVGAGTGARAGGLKGGVGSASAVLADGTTVAALVVVNAVGSTVVPATGQLYAAQHCMPGELPSVTTQPAEISAVAALGAGQATTLAVIATDATLTKAQCQKLAGIGHDGMARAVNPVHTMFDGDTVFATATCERDAPDPMGFHLLLSVAGDCVTAPSRTPCGTPNRRPTCSRTVRRMRSAPTAAELRVPQVFCGKPRFRPPCEGSSQREVTAFVRV